MPMGRAPARSARAIAPPSRRGPLGRLRLGRTPHSLRQLPWQALQDCPTAPTAALTASTLPVFAAAFSFHEILLALVGLLAERVHFGPDLRLRLGVALVAAGHEAGKLPLGHRRGDVCVVGHGFRVERCPPIGHREHPAHVRLHHAHGGLALMASSGFANCAAAGRAIAAARSTAPLISNVGAKRLMRSSPGRIREADRGLAHADAARLGHALASVRSACRNNSAPAGMSGGDALPRRLRVSFAASAQTCAGESGRR